MRRPDRRAVVHWAMLVTVLVLIAFVWYSGELQKARIDALDSWLTAEQENVEENGGTPVAPDPEEIIEDPEAEPPAGPSREDLNAAVEDAVEAYFLENPLPENATPAEIAAGIASGIANYIADHPEVTQPSQEQLDAAAEVAVAAYLTANPPADGEDGADGVGATGPPGPQGDPGTGPTFEELLAAVQAHFEEHPVPMCPEGYAPEARSLVSTDGPPVDALVCVAQAE